jgi:hypothetical protein
MFKEKKFFRKLKRYIEFYYKKNLDVQSDQKQNKSAQALQIIGHVVAEFYVNKRSMHGRRQFVVSNATL